MPKIDLNTIIGKRIKIKDDKYPDRIYEAIGYNLKEKTVIFLRMNKYDVVITRVHVKNVIVL